MSTRPLPTMLDAALSYAVRGWAVIPTWWPKGERCACGNTDCQHPGKHPLGKLAPHGLKDATTNSEVIEEWWGQYPKANIGIATGAESGLVVVDVDPRHGGLDSLKKLEALGSFPHTPKAKNGGGGWHIFLAHPGNGQTIKSRPLPDYPGIDIKADGGYIVALPSNHVSGGSYEWEIGPDTAVGGK